MASTNIPLPSVRPQPQGSQTIKVPPGSYGVPDVMIHGLDKKGSVISDAHPLEFSEKHWNENKRKMDFAMLRRTQGIHAPLKLQMESFAAQRPLRLPGLHCSNLMMDTLTGRDEIIDFEDILNNPADSEVSVHPHILMEKRLGLL